MKERLKVFVKKKSRVQIILSVFVAAILVARFLKGDYHSVFFCTLTLLLFDIPLFVDEKLGIEIPRELEAVILFFIFAAEILGELGSFYTHIPWWDTMLHTVNGFLMAAIGFALIDILNNSPRFHINLSPLFVAFVAFCFSMTVGVIWEFFEFSMDMLFSSDMQKDRFIYDISSVALNPSGLNDTVRINGIETTVLRLTDGGEYVISGHLDIGLIDTMKELIVNCVGAVVFSVIGYYYIIGRNKGVFAQKFIPKIKNKEDT